MASSRRSQRPERPAPPERRAPDEAEPLEAEPLEAEPLEAEPLEAEPLEVGPVEALRKALARLPGREATPSAPLLIAFSGGLDSTVLLHAAAQLLVRGDLAPDRLIAVHVDHGLQPSSATWVEHCRKVAAGLGVECRVLRLQGRPAPGDSIEAWAREGRYQAFAALARETGAAALLTAHHADDQIETFLLRLARGAGLDGMVAIEPDSMRGELRLLRPFLALPRGTLERWASEWQLGWVEDPTNADHAFLRNAVRGQIVPLLDRVLPGLRGHLPASLGSLREARDRLREIESEDLRSVSIEPGDPASGLSCAAWCALPTLRRAGVLRRWLAEQGARMPTRARLDAMIEQLESPRDDARIEVRHDGRVLRRYRDRILLAAAQPSSTDVPVGVGPVGVPIHWTGERLLPCPALGGVLRVEPVTIEGEPGFAADWLSAADLELRMRGGGERLRVRPGGPRRSLKKLFQERGIAPWSRCGLPVLWAADRPIWVAGIGADADCLVATGPRYRLDWAPGGGRRMSA